MALTTQENGEIDKMLKFIIWLKEEYPRIYKQYYQKFEDDYYFKYEYGT